MKILNIRFSKLQEDFFRILLLVALVPLAISMLLIYFHLRAESEITNIDNEKIEQQVRSIVATTIKTTQIALDSLAQTQELIDYLLSPMDLRAFSENRLNSKLTNISSSLLVPTKWILFDRDNQNVLSTISDLDVLAFSSSLSEGVHLSLNGKYVLIKKAIRLDDQQLQSKSSFFQGNIVAVIKSALFESLTPNFAEIVKISGKNDADLIELKIRRNSSIDKKLILAFLIISVAFLVFSLIAGSILLQKRMVAPILDLIENLGSKTSFYGFKKTRNEIEDLKNAINFFAEQMKKNADSAADKKRELAVGEIASQVAHDIRSPLSALTLLTGRLEQIPEENRLLIRHAVQRINDIANDLLARGRAATDVDKLEHRIETSTHPIFLAAEIESLVSEKRLQLRNSLDIDIDLKFDSTSYGAFAKIIASDFKRVLSNLINNSVESYRERSGRILVSASADNEKIRLRIVDFGCGIPDEVLRIVGQRRLSYGKNDHDKGFGLGLSHAFKTIENFGGQLIIKSKVGSGTTIEVVLPRCESPIWFANELAVSSSCTLVSVDDDSAIHSLWANRLNTSIAHKNKIDLRHFTSLIQFSSWHRSISHDQNIYFLIDYEFVNESDNGLKVIEALGIQDRSILVTSHYEEIQLQNVCSKLGVKIAPKGMVSLLPISINSTKSEPSASTLVNLG